MTEYKYYAARQLGKMGGLVKSAAKARAARRNGKKGGRPRKSQPVDAAPRTASVLPKPASKSIDVRRIKPPVLTAK